MGNTSPWAATNRRASLYTIDSRYKPQASSDKLRQSVIYASGAGMVIWSRAARELVSVIRYKPCEACIRGEAGGSFNKSNGAIASVPMRDLLIPLVDRPSHKSYSVRPARGSFSFPKIKAASFKLRAPQATSGKHQASSRKSQASSHERQATRYLYLRTVYKVSRI